MSIKNMIFLPVTISIAAFANAQLPQFPISFPFAFQPNPNMPGLHDITKYWSSVMNVSGCITPISQSILSGRIGNVGHCMLQNFFGSRI